MGTLARLTSYSHGGGCACKLGIDELRSILDHVKVLDHADVMIGLNEPDDAAVVRVAPDVAIVQTVDFFTPIVDDAYTWGRIAAANALSDVYAMGAQPISALNLIAWPRDLGFELLGEVLRGGGAVCQEAGCAVVGGHSIDDPEPKFGLAVTGTVHPDRVVTKRGASTGDVLFLTKPLGTGIISSAIKRGEAPQHAIDAAVASMTSLNRAAAEAMSRVGASAATDVTGFGLVGHLTEMLGDLDAHLEASALPLLTGALDLAAAGIIPGGTERNRQATEAKVDDSACDEALRWLLYDAQTSGGLLIATEPDRADALESELKEADVIAARIGRLAAGDGRIVVNA